MFHEGGLTCARGGDETRDGALLDQSQGESPCLLLQLQQGPNCATGQACFSGEEDFRKTRSLSWSLSIAA